MAPFIKLLGASLLEEYRNQNVFARKYWDSSPSAQGVWDEAAARTLTGCIAARLWKEY